MRGEASTGFRRQQDLAALGEILPKAGALLVSRHFLETGSLGAYRANHGFGGVLAGQGAPLLRPQPAPKRVALEARTGSTARPRPRTGRASIFRDGGFRCHSQLVFRCAGG